jgi:hypothetical protein
MSWFVNGWSSSNGRLQLKTTFKCIYGCHFQLKWLKVIIVAVSTHGHHSRLQFIFNLSIVAKIIIVGKVIFMNCNCSWAQAIKGGFLLLFGFEKELYTKWEEWAKGSCSKFMCTRKVLTCWCSPPYDLLYVDKWSKYDN